MKPEEIIDYKKILDSIHDFADEMNIQDKINAADRLHLLIGYVYGVNEIKYLIRKKIEEMKK